MSQKTVHVVSHTHWDREWYMPFELHRRRLVRLIDDLLDLLHADSEFRHFHLDGQMIPLHDYLEIRPHQRERVQAAVAAGRLSVGPWYVLQDEFLISGEANVRDLLYGLKAAREFGEPLRVGYLADAFGHVSQMPQILRGFGIDNAVFGRGVNNWNPALPAVTPEAERGYKSEFTWRAPDGSAVLSVFMANWYSNGMEMPTQPDACRDWMTQRLAACERFATTPQLLLMNGCDHTPTQKDLTQALVVARELFPEIEFRHSSLGEYVEAAAAAAGELQTVEGELRNQFTDGWGTLTNVLSSRLYLKQANWRCQTELEKWAEPFSALAWLLGAKYDHDLIDYCWRLLLQNHPHDSICGCSCDEVHREMEVRFQKSETLARQLSREAMERLAEHVDTSACPDGAKPVLVFNPLAIRRTEMVVCSADFAEDAAVPDVEVFDGQGNLVEACLEHDHGVQWGYHLPDDRFRETYQRRRICAGIPMELPPLGYATYFVRPRESRPFALPDSDAMANEFLSVELAADGTLNVRELTSGFTFRGLNQLQDSRDAGDEYNYRAPEEDVTWNIRLEKQSQFATPLYQTWELHGSMSDQGALAVRCFVTLGRDSRRVDVRTEIDNRKGNHRLRALFPTDVEADYATIDGQFDLVRRPIRPWHGWTNPSNCQPQQAFVDVSDESKGLTLANLGLPEYEVLRDGRNTLALTLLRAVGEIGDWGEFPTPDAQCQSEYVTEYSIIPHAGPFEQSPAQQDAYCFNWAPDTIPAEVHPGDLPPSGSLLTLTPDTLVLSALKKCEHRDSIIVRFYNPRATSAAAVLSVPWVIAEAHQTNLDERRLDQLAVHEHSVTLDVAPKQIVTLELVPERG